MNILPKKIRLFIVLPLLGVLLTISLLVLASFLVQKPSVQVYLIEKISDAIGYDITTGEIDLSLWRGIGIAVHDLEARSRQGFEKVNATRVKISLDAGQLLRGRIVPARIYLFQPWIELDILDEQGSSRAGESPKTVTRGLFWIPGIKSIVVDKGYLKIKNIPFTLHDLKLEAHPRDTGSSALRLKGGGKIAQKGKRVSFGLKGTIFQKEEKQGIPYVELALQLEKVPMSWIPWPEKMAFGGDFGAHLTMKGNLNGPISVGGQVFIDSFYTISPASSRAKVFTVSGVKLDFQSVISDKKIKVPDLKLKTDDVSLGVKLMIDLEERNNPYLDLEVTSQFIDFETFKKYFPMPIFPSWVENQLFAVLESGFVRLKLLSLKGNIEQLANLHLPQNQSAFAARLACKNFKVLGLGFKQPFKETSANVTLEKGTLLISDLRARFGRSTIKGASLNIRGLYSNRPSYEVLMAGSFELQDVIQQLEMDFIPQGIRKKLGSMATLSGNLECRAKVIYEKGSEYPRVTMGKFLITDCSVGPKAMVFPLVIKGLDIHIDKANQYRFTGAGAWGQSPFKITGGFGLTEGGFDLRKTDISAKADMKQVLSLFFPEEKSPLTFGRSIPLNVSIERKGDGWTAKGEADLEGVVLETRSLFIDPPGKQNKVAFEFDYENQGGIDLKKCQFNFSGSKLALSSSENFTGEDMIALRIFLSSFALKDLGLRFKKGAPPVRGRLSGDVKMRISRSSPSTPGMFGSLKGKNLNFTIDQLPGSIKKCDFKIDFSGQKIDIDFWKMRTGKSQLNIKGHLSGWKSMKGDLAVGSSYLDSADFLVPEKPSRVGDKKKAGRGVNHKRDIHITMDIKRGVWGKLKWGPLKTSLDLKGEDVYIRKLDVHLEHGVLNLKGHMRKKKKPTLLFSTHVKLNEQPIEELFKTFGMKEDPIKGKLTLDAYLFTKGKEKKDLIPNVTGSGTVLVKGGSIKNPHVIIKVLDFMSLQNIYKRKPSGRTENEFYFESIGGDAVINKGLLKTDNLVMKSPALKAVASGDLDMTRWTVDGKLGARPIETVDSVVSSLPILGYILTGEEKTILVYYFDIKGPLANPEVKYVPFKTLGISMASALKRLILSPVRMLKNLGEAVKKPPEFDPSDLPGPGEP